MARRGEVHNKIAVVLKSAGGNTVTLDELKTVFAGTKIEPVLYRISTYIWNIKKDGGVVQSVKDKRKLIGYQLLNHAEFNDQGYWVGKTDVKVAA
jgi:hypothetical protein